jgi:hypothetical protein
MFKIILSSSVLFFLSIVAQANPVGTCTGVRLANASVKVMRLHWQQINGNYKLKGDVACTSQTKVSVLPGPAAGCTYPILAKCAVNMDGTNYDVTVSGLVMHNTDPKPTKHFLASYHLDRNLGVVTTGEAGSADVYTEDLSMKNIGMSVNSKLDGPGAGSAMRDGLVVYVDYEDQNAP